MHASCFRVSPRCRYHSGGFVQRSRKHLVAKSSLSITSRYISFSLCLSLYSRLRQIHFSSFIFSRSVRTESVTSTISPIGIRQTQHKDQLCVLRSYIIHRGGSRCKDDCVGISPSLSLSVRDSAVYRYSRELLRYIRT